MSEIKTKISTYNDVVDLFGEEKAADMLSEALDWSTIDPKNDKKNDVFISVSPDVVLRQYPDITIDEAIQIRDNACENIWESGGQSDLDEIVWDQIGAEYKSIKSDSHRGLSDVKDAKAKQAVHVNDDRENDAVALDVQEK